MRRRQFIAGVVGAGRDLSVRVRAQQGDRVRRIGVLMSGLTCEKILTPDDPSGDGEIAAFRQGLEELSWTDGRNINIQLRWTGADLDRIRASAKEFVELRPDVLVARSTPTTLALKRETDTIPVVFVNVSEPVGSGLAQTLARPGGNLTGFTSFESSIGGKLLELLKQTDTRITRAGIIYNPQTAPYARLFLNSVQSAAPPTGSPATENTIGTVRVICSNGATAPALMGQDNVRREGDQFIGVPANVSRIRPGPVGIDLHIAADGPTQKRQRL